MRILQCSWTRRPALLLLGLALLLVLVVRLRLLDMPLERDEGEYAYAGQQILHGIPPYQDVYNMKLPGVYGAYAVIMAIFGQSPAGIHLGLLALSLGSLLMVFFLGRRLLDDTAGAVAALCFALFTLSPSMLGLAAHATHFVVFFALAGILLLLRAASLLHAPPSPQTHGARGNASVFFSGLLFGIAFLMKQHGVFFGLFGGCYLLGIMLSRHRQQRADFLAKPWLHSGRAAGPAEQPASPPAPAFRLMALALLSIGFVLPYALTCLTLWLAGVFPAFWFWTVSYARQYASLVSSEEAQWMFRIMTNIVVGPSLPLWLLAVAGFMMLWSEKRLGQPVRTARVPLPSPPREERAGERRPTPAHPVPNPCLFLTLLLICSAATVGIGFYFRPHYFITLAPIMSLLAGIAVSRALLLVRQAKTLELLVAVPVLVVFALGTLVVLIGNAGIWFSLTPEAAVREIYGTTLFSDAAHAADIIRKDTPPDARVAVLGSEPEIYFLSRRRSATGYIYTYPLMEPHPYAAVMQREMSEEIERAHPDYAVFVADPVSWLQRPDSEKNILTWWDQYSRTNFVLQATYDIQGREEPPATGTEPQQASRASANPEPPKYLLLYKRRPNR